MYIVAACSCKFGKNVEWLNQMLDYCEDRADRAEEEAGMWSQAAERLRKEINKEEKEDV